MNTNLLLSTVVNLLTQVKNTHLFIEFCNLGVNHKVLRNVHFHKVTSKVCTLLQFRPVLQKPLKDWINNWFITLYNASSKIIPKNQSITDNIQ